MTVWAWLFVLLIVLMMAGILSFELLVYNLFAHHRAEWVKAGHPIVFGQSPLTVGLYGWLVARHMLQKELFLTVPRWTEQDRFAYLLLLVYKATSFLVLAAVPGFLIFALLLS